MVFTKLRRNIRFVKLFRKMANNDRTRPSVDEVEKIRSSNDTQNGTQTSSVLLSSPTTIFEIRRRYPRRCNITNCYAQDPTKADRCHRLGVAVLNKLLELTAESKPPLSQETANALSSCLADASNFVLADAKYNRQNYWAKEKLLLSVLEGKGSSLSIAQIELASHVSRNILRTTNRSLYLMEAHIGPERVGAMRELLRKPFGLLLTAQLSNSAIPTHPASTSQTTFASRTPPTGSSDCVALSVFSLVRPSSAPPPSGSSALIKPDGTRIASGSRRKKTPSSGIQLETKEEKKSEKRGNRSGGVGVSSIPTGTGQPTDQRLKCNRTPGLNADGSLDRRFKSNRNKPL